MADKINSQDLPEQGTAVAADGDRPSAEQATKAKKSKRKDRRKTLPSRNRPLICPPDRAGMGVGSRVGGMVCRVAVIFAAVFGLMFFLCDALRLEQQEISVTAGFLALVSLIFVLLYSAMATSWYGLFGGGVVILGGACTFLILIGDVADFTVKTFLTAKNVALTRLYKLGYYAMSEYMTEVSYTDGRGAEFYMKAALILLAALVALVFVLSCIKRVRLVGPVIVSAVIISVVFTYNISRSNWGTVLIIASFVGLIVMYTYDRLFSASQDTDKFDSDTVLFADNDRPAMPDGVPTPAVARMLRRQKRREYRELKKQHRRDKTQLTVEEELDNYFGTSVKSSKVKKKDVLTPEQKRRQRETDAQVRRVRRYDRAVTTSRRAQGGFAAAGAFVLAMIIMLLPALTINGSFSTIDAIDKKMEYYREYVTALLMGEGPVIDELSYQNNKDNFEPHSTEATPRYYTGKKLMQVETQYTANVYLRGWIGTSYSDGAWNACSDDELEAYRKLYGTTLDADEILFHRFYSIMDSSAVEGRDFTKSNNSKLKYGFVAMQVNINREKTDDALVYMPSFYRVDDEIKSARSSANGLYKYGESEASDVTFVNYFDGIYTGRKFMSEMSYASVAYVTFMRTNDWYRNVASLIAQFNEGYNDAYDQIEKYAEQIARGRNASLDNIVDAIFPEASENVVSVTTDGNTKYIEVDYPRGRVLYSYDVSTGQMISYKITKLTEFTTVDEVTGEVTTYTLAFAPSGVDMRTRFRELMTAEQKRELAYAYYWQYLYENFVYETYTTPYNQISRTVKETLSNISIEDGDGSITGADIATLAAMRHSDDAATYEARHKLVMAIVDYLKENCTYTLTPTATANPSLDGVDNFLGVTHEGYCTQYASALALMLRAAGIPARYVEGYVACDFRRNYSSDSVARYYATVCDYNAHAWVEVWYDGVGWVQYEATPVYYDDMYTNQSGSQGGNSTRPWYDPENDMSEEQEMLDSLQSSIELAAARAELIRDDSKMLIGRAEITAKLDSLEKLIEEYRDRWTLLNDLYQSSKNEQGYNGDGVMHRLSVLENEFDTDVTLALNSLEERVEAMRSRTAAVRNVIIAVAVIALAVLMILLANARANKAERSRTAILESVIEGSDDPAGRRQTARSIIDWLTALLAAYGSAPAAGEFRDEYARRLEAEYLTTFGRPQKAQSGDAEAPVELVSDTDFAAIFDAIAAEEFGSGMTDEQLHDVAVFCQRMRSVAKLRLSWVKRIYYHFIKRII